ncbi:hypothetical protein IAQ61_006078 [Plenodomus lingam]|uniref:Similar to glutathione S-transferase n=1 Tax=Leptosphaeria maculans (strain JN3 / isolate v23.1.3 / race Av1-4-5-6-7-8) TaxID=985895 RepID=E4ZMS4_LEPMJ|nr:similar to glutathione S-transferase [Plenodomus lingam JN3]KAH9870601.1 hypothetical protein IAQ61_006078 [Plenodomus lingam]CBX92527.1 similar to glutathione S-transferase [Plenodomus lingam JN3]
MSESEIVLYDLASKHGKAWSLNPWKTRMVLNYKSIPYRTHFLEYPDLAPTLLSLGIPPNPKSTPGYAADYTSPAVRYADGTYGMDSWPIAHTLETQYPEPSLHLEDPIVVQVRDAIMQLFVPLRAHLIPKVPGVLSERSQEYFYRTRRERFGRPLQEVGAEAGEAEWETARKPAEMMGDMLRRNGGPFFLGDKVSYADVIFVTALHCFKCVEEELFTKLVALDPAFSKIYEASKQWLEKDD